MLKCCDLMYCFEIDGTLMNNIPNHSTNILSRNYNLVKSDCIFNPNVYDIRWTVVTNRPKIDFCSIKLCCFLNGIVPCDIITSNKYFGTTENDQLNADFKIELFRNILDSKLKVKYTKNSVKRIINVCNNQTENYYINSRRDGYEFISVNVIDFKREFFNKIV